MEKGSFLEESRLLLPPLKCLLEITWGAWEREREVFTKSADLCVGTGHFTMASGRVLVWCWVVNWSRIWDGIGGCFAPRHQIAAINGIPHPGLPSRGSYKTGYGRPPSWMHNVVQNIIIFFCLKLWKVLLPTCV